MVLSADPPATLPSDTATALDETVPASVSAASVRPAPFSVSQARQAWGTSRRVAVPLMEWLDARGVTVRLPDNSRRLR